MVIEAMSVLAGESARGNIKNNGPSLVESIGLRASCQGGNPQSVLSSRAFFSASR
jgi:hypothetical protein